MGPPVKEQRAKRAASVRSPRLQQIFAKGENLNFSQANQILAGPRFPRPVFCCSSSIFFDASAFVQSSLNSSPASRQSVWRYERCGPVIASSFVTHSSGSFSGLRDAGGTSGGTSSDFIIADSCRHPRMDLPNRAVVVIKLDCFALVGQARDPERPILPATLF